jgi:predicted nuclease of predicted toxin-antitoxin system
MKRILADECFSGHMFRAMLNVGFDVVRSAETCPAGTDEQILALAFAQSRLLLTEDNDFGDLTVRLGLPTLGVIRVDLKTLDKASQVERLLKARAELSDKKGVALVTIEPTRTRVRRLD